MSVVDTKHAVLGMPGYGSQTAAAGRGFWLATRGPQAQVPLQITRNHRSGSLLAANFNALWCMALNLCHKGNRVDYFAMLHDDVEPEDFWLDTLIEELEAKNLDVLGVPVPIKDAHGLTSLALQKDTGNPAEDNWFPLCRLSLREVHQLPETFTSEDVGHPLLLNTGCWVCRFDPAWASKMFFTINDRIIFDESKNCYLANVEPEDWFFSRLCHEQGLKIGATRKVKIDHAGATRFRNDVAWGDAFDSAYVAESVLTKADADGWRFPADVDGWLTREEGKGLAELARGKRVLEIGSYCGKSTICMAQTADHVLAVDYFDGRGTPRPRNTMAELLSNAEKYGVAGTITLRFPGESYDLPQYETAEFGLIFIDGAHDYESVQTDIRNALELLKPGGLIAFHDYRRRPGEHDGRWDEGVTQSVDEWVSQGAEIVARNGTVAVVRPPALVEA